MNGGGGAKTRLQPENKCIIRERRRRPKNRVGGQKRGRPNHSQRGSRSTYWGERVEDPGTAYGIGRDGRRPKSTRRSTVGQAPAGEYDLRPGTLTTYNWAQVLEACDCLKLLCIYFDLSLRWCHWRCLPSAWSSRHWSPCCRLWRVCQDAQLILPVLLPLPLSHQCHQQSGDCSASNADYAFMMFWGNCQVHFHKYFKEGGWEETFLSDSKCLQPVSYAVVKEDCAGGLVIEVFDDSNKAGTEVMFFMDAHKAASYTLSKVFLKSIKTW